MIFLIIDSGHSCMVRGNLYTSFLSTPDQGESLEPELKPMAIALFFDRTQLLRPPKGLFTATLFHGV